ncbi:MAG: DUF192 domain-containing protein [Chloroflexi bacterium]|nr:DUF192 domain-containing protein [Chloroflexota bacterium]
MRRPLAAITAIAILLLTGACSSSSEAPSGGPTAEATAPMGQPRLPTIAADINGITYMLEVADDPAERAGGLSGRKRLDANTGMLFVWEEVAPRELWMKGMRFPLDFVWLNEERRVVRIDAEVEDQPGASDSELVRYPSGAPVTYVIELGAGVAASHGLRVGDVVEFDERLIAGAYTAPTPTPRP